MTRTLSKGVTLAALAVAAFVLLGLSLPKLTAGTSGNPRPASTAAPVSLTVPTKANKKKPLSPITLAPAARKIAPSLLLPVVQQQDISQHHQQLADAVLRALPPHCRTYLQNFYVRYGKVENRGLGGKTTIIIAGSVPDSEFVGLLVHECGHVTHSNLTGSAPAAPSAFKDGKELLYADSPIIQFFSISWTREDILNKSAKKADFASGYAESDAFEDFAETFAMYILHRPAMRERAKENEAIAAKLLWMETYLPVGENMLSTSEYTWNKKVPWDITRLPGRLHASLLK